MEKTDLTKILSVSGQHGLWRYLAQARNGAIVESLSTGERKCFDAKRQISTLADISIYTSEGELRLKEVFLKMKEVLADKPAPAGSDAKALKDLFTKAVPNYDADRFYASHMKKVASWYNEILEHASFDFVEEEEQGASEEESPKEEA